VRTTFESLSAGGGFGHWCRGRRRDRWRRESSQYPSATQLHKGRWCQSRRKTTGQAVQTGGSRRTSRCQTDPPRSGLDGGVMGARPACLLHSIAPAKIGRAHGERESSQQSAPGTAAVTDARQMLDRCSTGAQQSEAERQRHRHTGWSDLGSSRNALVGLRRAAALVHRQAAPICVCVCPSTLSLAADG
jgi:hypothetical protein